MTIRIAVFILAASSTVLAQRAVPPARSHHPDIPYQSPTSLGAATYAKVLCSAVFVSGRDAEEAKQNSAYFLMTEPDRARSRSRRTSIARPSACASRWTTSRARRRSTAIKGCVIHPVDHDGVHFTPVPVRTTLPDAATQPWPMGDAPSTRAVAGRTRSREDAGGRRSRVRRSRGPHRRDGRACTRARSSASATWPASPRTRSSKAGRWARASPPRWSAWRSRTARSRSTIPRRCPTGGGPAIRAAPFACAT